MIGLMYASITAVLVRSYSRYSRTMSLETDTATSGHPAAMISAVRRSAEQAGRDSGQITFCVAAPAYVGDDFQHQRDQTPWFGGMGGHHGADIHAPGGLVEQQQPGRLLPVAAADQPAADDDLLLVAAGKGAHLPARVGRAQL